MDFLHLIRHSYDHLLFADATLRQRRQRSDSVPAQVRRRPNARRRPRGDGVCGVLGLRHRSRRQTVELEGFVFYHRQKEPADDALPPRLSRLLQRQTVRNAHPHRRLRLQRHVGRCVPHMRLCLRPQRQRHGLLARLLLQVLAVQRCEHLRVHKAPFAHVQHLVGRGGGDLPKNGPSLLCRLRDAAARDLV